MLAQRTRMAAGGADTNAITGTLVGPTTLGTSTSSTATAYSNQRKVDRCQNGVLWTCWVNGLDYVFAYSVNDGTSFTAAVQWTSTSTTYTGNLSFFIDLDDYAHVVYKDANDGYIYYRRGTPNAGRTAWTWSSATVIDNSFNDFNYPDVVAHREGTGWVAHVVYSRPVTTASAVRYNRVTITSGGSLSTTGLANIPASNGSANHTWPSIDFNHTGDGKTVAGSTPHLYVAWSAGGTGAGNGIRFIKATYSGGTWTWGTEREIDNTRYVAATAGEAWLNCLFDGTRVVIVGMLTDSGSVTRDIMAYDRDVADTTTTTNTILDSSTTDATNRLWGGSATYDSAGNLYLFGRPQANAGSRDVRYRKWTRSGATFGSAVIIVSGASVGEPYVSVKRGYSNGRIEFIYTDGTASPYNVNYGAID